MLELIAALFFIGILGTFIFVTNKIKSLSSTSGAEKNETPAMSLGDNDNTWMNNQECEVNPATGYTMVSGGLDAGGCGLGGDFDHYDSHSSNFDGN